MAKYRFQYASPPINGVSVVARFFCWLILRRVLLSGMDAEESLTECNGDGCFAKDWCRRFSATPGENRFVTSPIDKMSGRCEYFIPISDEYANAVPH